VRNRTLAVMLFHSPEVLYLPTSLQSTNPGLQCIISSEAVTDVNPVEREGFFFTSGVVLGVGVCVKEQEGRFFLCLPPHLLITEVISACR